MNHVSDKRLVSILYKLIPKINTKKTINSIKKYVGDLSIHIIKESAGMANMHIKRCSVSLSIKEIQIKTTTKYHSIPIRVAKIKKPVIPSVDENVE